MWEIVYKEILDTHPKLLEIFKISPKYLNIDYVSKLLEETRVIQDISSNPSANVENNSIPRLKYEVNCIFFRYLTFKKLYYKLLELYGVNLSKKLLMSLLDGHLYLHDSSAYLIPYCLGVDFSKIIDEGMKGTKLISLPPKKPKSFMNQVKEAIIELSNEFAGAISFPTLILLYTFVYLKYYGKDASINEKEVEDDFQNLVHTINKDMRNGVENPFTNLSFFDRFILKELSEIVYKHYLNQIDISVEEFISKVNVIQEIVLKFFAKKDPSTNSFYPFPVLTANFLLDENNNIVDENFLELVAKYNTEGMLNIYCSKDVRKYSMCCRFQPDYHNVKFDSFGNGGINIGSIKVVTINLNRIALDFIVLNNYEYNCKDEDYQDYVLFSNEVINEFLITHNVDKKFYLLLELVYSSMKEAKMILDAYRNLLREVIREGKLKYFKQGWFDLDKNFYSTIGFIGLYEMYNTLKDTLESLEVVNRSYEDFGIVILSFMDYVISIFNKESHKFKYNLEQVPGESLASLFPKLDKYFYGEEKVPYVLYSNQFIPLYEFVSVMDKILIESKFFKYLSGGGISHINISEKLTPEVMKSFIKSIAKQGIEHFALNPVFSICNNNHYTFGKVEVCQVCGAKVVDYMTRVVGFFAKVSKWNKERREWEFAKRIWNNVFQI